MSTVFHFFIYLLVELSIFKCNIILLCNSLQYNFTLYIYTKCFGSKQDCFKFNMFVFTYGDFILKIIHFLNTFCLYAETFKTT